MYIHVKLLNGFREKLTYQIPVDWDTKNLIGSIVRVPLQKRIELAVIENIFENIESTSYTIRQAYSLEKFPSDKHYNKFIEQLSNYYVLEPIIFYKRLQSFIKQQAEEEPIIYQSNYEFQQKVLTHAQQEIVNKIMPAIENPVYQPHLLHGVTGSGKTEIYKKLIEHAYSKNKTSLFLLPEVTLAVQFAQLFKKEFSSNVEVLSFHSAVNTKEKNHLWNQLLIDNPLVILGVHLPILLPISNLGLIIIDEEHDSGYQEKKHPKINTKEAALIRAQTYRIPIVLGSATPSISSLYNVTKRNWQLLTLHERFAGAFPKIKVVKLEVNQKRAHFWISTALEQAIKEQLQQKRTNHNFS